MASSLPESIQIGECRVTWHDVIAGVVSIIAVSTVMAQSLLQIPISSDVMLVAGVAISWLFRGAADKLTENSRK